MKLYNSLTRGVEPFVPQGDPVTLYVCGITPYDTTHLGHAATYCSFDVLVRYLEYRGLQVRYIQNVTDVDDDTIREAPKRGTTWDALGNRWTAHFIQDMLALNVRPPDYYPRATGVIPEIIALAATLQERDLAYASNGSLYFHVDSDPEFGRLSHIAGKAEMLRIANERGNFPDDPNKRDPLDFVLWQAQKPGEPAWDSPWGPGRPGWHIECSSMALKYLGPTIDIHGGGADLIFPHHECELAQTTEATGKEYFARVWMHTGMVGYQGEKMSKSLGNLVMVSDLLKEYSPDALRLYLARHHYREAWEHTAADLRASLDQCQEIKTALGLSRGSRDGAGQLGAPLFAERARADFERALDNDLDTVAAADILCSLSGEIVTAAEEGQEVGGAQRTLRTLAGVLGLKLDSGEPEARVRRGWEQHLEQFTGLVTGA